MDKKDGIAVRTGSVPAFSMENNLTVSDILSVAVGEAEGKLQIALKAGMVKIRAIETRVKEIGKGIDEEIHSLYKACGLQDDIENANKILGKLFETSISWSVSIDEKQKLVVYRYGLANCYEYKKVPFSTEIIRLVDLLESEKESLEVARGEVAEIRKRIANIPALERRYRGKLVASQLGKTAEGKSVLALITANIEDELKNI